MKKYSIEEGTKLIAAFYGSAYNHVQDYYLIKGLRFMGKIEEMKFHSSWDWIMPVVNKIHDLVNSEHKVSEKEAMIWCSVMDAIVAVDIDKAFNCVYHYVAWHNKSGTPTLPHV